MVRSPECDIAWRVLDAQYWGVPQRRKRIFLVADFGAGERCADEILFERQSLPRNTQAGREAWKGSAAGFEDRIGAAVVRMWAGCAGGGALVSRERSLTLKANTNDQILFTSIRTVRRLTTTECERIQGLPDGYTLIDDKTCSDTARYKALGNGMAQPCADWIIKRIVDFC